MVFRFGLLIPYFIIFLSFRECLFPIQLRQWCRNHIGVFPLGLHPDGFPCFKFDLFGLNRYRDHDHEFIFSKSRKDFESQIWYPGDSKFKTETGGIRPWISHICGNLFPFVAEIGILVVPDVDVDVLFHLLRIPFGIREISKFKTRDIFLRFAGLYQFGCCRIEMSILHLVLITFLRQVLVGIAQIWRLQNGLAAFRWESIDMRRHDSESFQATYQSVCSIKVMRKTFRSFIYKMIACYKCMKRGLNRFILLPVRLLLESRVTSTSSSKLGFNFLYLFQRLYLNVSLYHVSCIM